MSFCEHLSNGIVISCQIKALPGEFLKLYKETPSTFQMRLYLKVFEKSEIAYSIFIDD